MPAPGKICPPLRRSEVGRTHPDAACFGASSGRPMDSSSSSLDDLVHSVGLYVPRPLILHGYIFPFLILYGIWGWAWVAVYGWEEYFEAGLIALAGVGCLQILTCLFCHWSVHVRCLFTCRRVSSRRPWGWQGRAARSGVRVSGQVLYSL